MILADIKLLQSLPEQQVRSGLCETIKNVLAIYPEEINRLKEVLPSALRLELEALEIISEISIKSKLRVMKNDKFEKKNALVLEYGHTTGHAIELIIAKNKLPNITHGEAVGIGMIVAAEISHALGHLSPTEVTLHYDLLQIIRSPTEIPNNIHVHDLIEHMKHDNKRGYVNSSKNEVGFILLEKLGSPLGKPECPITLIDEKTIENAIVKINNNFIPQKHYAGYKY